MMFAGLAAQERPKKALACNLNAISSEELPRHRELFGRLVGAVREQRELANGYALRLDGGAIRLAEAAEWMERERKCCPFLTLQLETTGQERDSWLRLTGPDGVKELLAGWSSADK